MKVKASTLVATVVGIAAGVYSGIHLLWRVLALILMWRAHRKTTGLPESAAY
jgi:preprotein translocase subunit SecF